MRERLAACAAGLQLAVARTQIAEGFAAERSATTFADEARSCIDATVARGSLRSWKSQSAER